MARITADNFNKKVIPGYNYKNIKDFHKTDNIISLTCKGCMNQDYVGEYRDDIKIRVKGLEKVGNICDMASKVRLVVSDLKSQKFRWLAYAYSNGGVMVTFLNTGQYDSNGNTKPEHWGNRVLDSIDFIIDYGIPGKPKVWAKYHFYRISPDGVSSIGSETGWRGRRDIMEVESYFNHPSYKCDNISLVNSTDQYIE